MSASTDYDAPRVTVNTDSLEELKARRANTRTVSTDIDEVELGEGFELPEVLDEQLTITVIPMQANEFRCDWCFLIRHHSQRHHQPDGKVCRDCAECVAGLR